MKHLSTLMKVFAAASMLTLEERNRLCIVDDGYRTPIEPPVKPKYYDEVMREAQAKRVRKALKR